MIRKILGVGSGIAGLLLLYATLIGLPVQDTIPPETISLVEAGGGERAYFTNMERSRWWADFVSGDSVEIQESELLLFENGQLLGPPHASHFNVGALGGGRYSHWNSALYFSSIDNSDPRTNGRSYTYEVVARLPTIFAIVGIICIVAALWVGRQVIQKAVTLAIQHPKLRFPLPLTGTVAMLLVATSMLWLFQLLVSASQDVSQDDVATIIAYCCFVVVLQSLIVLFFPRYISALFVLFGVSNAYLLYFVFSGDLTTRPLYIQLALLISIGSLYFVLLQFLRFAEGLRGWVVSGSALFLLMVGIFGVAPIARVFATSPPSTLENPQQHLVDFRSRPNVYFLGFDALMPAPLAEKLMEFPDPPYVEVIQNHGGRIIPNLFADRVPTARFWATTLNVLPVSDNLAKDFVVGIQPSAVLGTFQHNGFATHFTFWNAFMGANRGRFLDSYVTADPYSTCSFLGDLPNRIGFFGYCSLRATNWLTPAPTDKTTLDHRNEFYLERVRSVSRDPSPKSHFFASHYPWPGHTDTTFRRTTQEIQTFRRQYRSGAQHAADILDRMLTEIQTSDPDAIIFVFGDHGSYLSKGINYEDNPEFVVQDLHGIMGAVFGADSCAPFLQPPAGEGFQTSSRVVAGLLQCLSGGESTLKTQYDFGKISTAPDNMRFEDYVYE